MSKCDCGSERSKAIEFLNSRRGQFILGQALCVAIDTLEEVQPPLKEVSNIADMRYLRDNLFPQFKQLDEMLAPEGWRGGLR